jgi:hypothetical protein
MFMKGLTTTTNFLEVLVNDEESTLAKLNRSIETNMCFQELECQRKGYL